MEYVPETVEELQYQMHKIQFSTQFPLATTSEVKEMHVQKCSVMNEEEKEAWQLEFENHLRKVQVRIYGL